MGGRRAAAVRRKSLRTFAVFFVKSGIGTGVLSAVMKNGAFRRPFSCRSSTKNRVSVRTRVRLENKSSGFFQGHDHQVLTGMGKSSMKLGMTIDEVWIARVLQEEIFPTWSILSVGTAIEFIAGPESIKMMPRNSMRPITKDRVGTSEEIISLRLGWVVSLFG